MKTLTTALLTALAPLMAHTQISIDQAKLAAQGLHLGSYSYHEVFIGHANYGAPVILTDDGGAALFGAGESEEGSGALLVKLNSAGEEEWSTLITTTDEEMEPQSVIQNAGGDYFVFMLVYNSEKYRGGCQRMVKLDAQGNLLWDKMVGEFTLLNNPTIGRIMKLSDGSIQLRGQVVIDEPVEGHDPQYRFWEAMLSWEGQLKQEVGGVIDWKQDDWKVFLGLER